MCAVNGDKLGQEDRALLVHLVPRRLAGRIANASSDIPPEVARLLWTWWRGFERVYEKRGREGLLQERDALQRRYNEVMAKCRQLGAALTLVREPMKGYRSDGAGGEDGDGVGGDDPNEAESATLRHEGDGFQEEMRRLGDEADDIQKQIQMIEAIFRYGPQMPEFIETAYARVGGRRRTVRSERPDGEIGGSPFTSGRSLPRDPMRWEHTAIGLYAYLEKVEGTTEYPTALTGAFGLETSAKAWIKGSTSTRQTRQYMQQYGYQKRGGVPSLHNALRQWILDFSREMGEEQAALIHTQMARKKMKWPGLPGTNRPEIQET